MPKPAAIVDSSFLVYLTKIKSENLFYALRLVFDQLLFPLEVVKEFTPKDNRPENTGRNQVIKQLDDVYYPFYTRCTSLDRVVMKTLEATQKVDRGEAEAIAQARARHIRFILTDDKKQLTHLPDPFKDLKYFNSLTIVCLLDLRSLLKSYQTCIQELHKIRPFKARDLHEAYHEAAQHERRAVSAKTLSEKCGLKNIGIK